MNRQLYFLAALLFLILSTACTDTLEDPEIECAECSCECLGNCESILLDKEIILEEQIPN